jgi:uncharacterized protein
MKHPDQAETSQDKEFVEGLVSGGYLIGDAIDEVTALRVQANMSRLSSSTLALTIAPTLACNFSCDYCFESQSAVRMSEQTQRALLDFADYHLEEASKLLVCWFGGEPTLCLPIIERLQTELLEIAERHNAQMEPTSLITNGYLLDGKMARKLRNLDITEAQITIDGPPAVHDRRRKLRNGKGTFARIMDNLTEISDILTVGIRINVDRENTEEACQVVEILRDRKILSSIKVSFAQVQSSGAACADIRDRCLGHEEFSRWQVRLYKNLMDKGIYHVDYPEISGGVTCGAVSKNSFVISPTGDCFKCWEELSLDREKSIGDIFSSQPNEQQKVNIERFRAWNPFEMAECRECDILPICLGGCPIHGLNAGDKDRGACSPWKFNLRDMLELRYQCEAAREAMV